MYAEGLVLFVTYYGDAFAKEAIRHQRGISKSILIRHKLQLRCQTNYTVGIPQRIFPDRSIRIPVWLQAVRQAIVMRRAHTAVASPRR